VQTLKTAVVVVLLLVVFYGVYEMLNRPPDAPPPEVAATMDDMPFDPPDVQFGDVSRGGMAEPTVSVPPLSTGGTVESPVPPDTIAAAGSSYPAPSFPAAGAANPPFDQPSAEPEYPLTVEPPTAAVPAASVAAHNGPRTGPNPAPPGDPRLQQNPFLHENVVTQPSSATAASGDATGPRAFDRAGKLAKALLEEGKYREALATLSVFYQSPDLTREEHEELLNLLDPLAGRVIYSREHLLAPAHTVRRNETLTDIAEQYNVPMELLQKINGIDTPNVLVPGTELKVVTGPFRADVNLQGQELTVFLNDLYAGRFPITVGRDPAPVMGDFKVREKREHPDYFSMDGRKIPAGNPANPFGSVWLDLGREVSIHGSPSNGADPGRGCISLSPQDAEDVYGILSLGSAVRILR
jgi:lipoprotein-anchoring transpeptidase ErfK/SrfK